MSAPRLTLAQQLKRLEEDERPVVERDVEHDEELGGWVVPGSGEYGDITTSVRDKTASTLSHLDAKYGVGAVGKRAKVKVFDDDLSEDDEERIVRGEDGWGGDASDGDSQEGDSDEEEDSEEEEDDEDEEEDEDEEDEEEPEDDAAHAPTTKPTPTPHTTLNPLAALQASKSKETTKGRAILRQQKLFDELLTVRITFQKAWTAGRAVPAGAKRKAGEMDAEEDLTTSTLATHRARCVQALHALSEDMFVLRARVAAFLPGAPAGDVKRRRVQAEGEAEGAAYWKASAGDSLDMMDSSHDALLTTLTKWSTKIQAASIQQAMLAGKASGNGNKFSTAGAGQAGVVEAIDGALNSKALSHMDGDDLFPAEETFYKSLLREVIEARAAGTGGASGIDVSQLRSEKKKRRDAERGASKGRKIRYTVHEKAQNFVVPIPLGEGWGVEQVDELFTSLLGGAGLAGAGAERDDLGVMGAAVEGDEDGLGGLRVF